MQPRTKLMVAAGVLILAAMGWMIHDGSRVPEIQVTAARLGPQPAAAGAAAPAAPGAGGKTGSSAGDGKPENHYVIAQDKLSKLYIVKCSACHGRDGKGPIGPSIAGKSYEHNSAALKKYKANAVENTMMKDLLTTMNDAEIELLSREVSGFH